MSELRSEELAILSRVYSFKTMRKLFPRQDIYPTDLDARWLIECGRAFLWLEFKCDVKQKPISGGQWRAWKTLLYQGRPNSMLFAIQHPDLRGRDIDAMADATAFKMVAFDDVAWKEDRFIAYEGIRSTDWLEPQDLAYFIQEWFRRTEEKPNELTTRFRQLIGV